MAEDFESVLATRTKKDFYRLLRAIVQYFDLICFMLGRVGTERMLDENSVGILIIQQTAFSILYKPEAIIKAKYAEMHDKVGITCTAA